MSLVEKQKSRHHPAQFNARAARPLGGGSREDGAKELCTKKPGEEKEIPAFGPDSIEMAMRLRIRDTIGGAGETGARPSSTRTRRRQIGASVRDAAGLSA